jgi:hypothetical protein
MKHYYAMHYFTHQKKREAFELNASHSNAAQSLQMLHFIMAGFVPHKI